MKCIGQMCDTFQCYDDDRKDHLIEDKKDLKKHPQFCYNGGVCSASGDLCKCPDGYTGRDCSHSLCGTYPIKLCSPRGVCDIVTQTCLCDEWHADESCTTRCVVGYNLPGAQNDP